MFSSSFRFYTKVLFAIPGNTISIRFFGETSKGFISCHNYECGQVNSIQKLYLSKNMHLFH